VCKQCLVAILLLIVAASTELQTAFKSLLDSPDTFGLLAIISSSNPPQIIPKSPPGLLSSNGSFEENLTSVLGPHLQNNEALYIMLRQAPSDKFLTIATYVPDSAPVRQKMLFASSRLTLTRELGSEHFGETLFCTLAKELSPQGWKEHLAHSDAPAPLTEEEQGIESLKIAEASEVGGTTRRGAGYGPSDYTGGSGSVSGVGKLMETGEGVQDALRDLKPGGLVALKIDDKERLVLAQNPEVGFAPGDVGGRIATDGPRYTVYHMTEPADAGVVFIYTCPTVTKVRDRMMYASSRRSAEAVAVASGVTLSKKVSTLCSIKLILIAYRLKQLSRARLLRVYYKTSLHRSRKRKRLDLPGQRNLEEDDGRLHS
jgi:twinfilin